MEQPLDLGPVQASTGRPSSTTTPVGPCLDHPRDGLATGKPTAAGTKRERRRTPMAHLPSKGGDEPPETN
jgi:hypothetical protein